MTINKYLKPALSEFIDLWAEMDVINKDLAYEMAIDVQKAFNNKAQYPLTYLEDQWYNSLSMGMPDYSVYNDQYLLSDIWGCWTLFSRQYLLRIKNDKSMVTSSILSDLLDVKSVVDLGCGIGYSTSVLKDYFPNADVYGTNLLNTIQAKVATEMSIRNNWKLVPDAYNIGQIDLVFASEYFEHIENAIEELIKLVEIAQPKALIIANSFNTHAIGHFFEYKHHDKIIPANKMSRLFSKTLKELGYKNVKTKCWNNKPAYWKKIDA